MRVKYSGLVGKLLVANIAFLVVAVQRPWLAISRNR